MFRLHPTEYCLGCHGIGAGHIILGNGELLQDGMNSMDGGITDNLLAVVDYLIALLTSLERGGDSCDRKMRLPGRTHTRLWSILGRVCNCFSSFDVGIFVKYWDPVS